MTEQDHLYVPVEISNLLKEKGFDEPCMSFYNTNITLAPTIQDVVQWLYEKYNLFITVTPNLNGNTFTVDIFKLDETCNEWYDINDGTELVYSGETVFEKDFTNPIDAYNDAITYCIKIA